MIQNKVGVLTLINQMTTQGEPLSSTIQPSEVSIPQDIEKRASTIDVCDWKELIYRNSGNDVYTFINTWTAVKMKNNEVNIYILFTFIVLQ